MESKRIDGAILIVGGTGSGKSTLCNTLAGKQLFKVSHTLMSATKDYQTEVVRLGNLNVKIVDSPSINSNNPNASNIRNKIRLLKEGFNVCLYLFDGTKRRISEHDIRDIEYYTAMFRKTDNFKILITRMNVMKDGVEKQVLIKQYLTNFAKKISEHEDLPFTNDDIFIAEPKDYDDVLIPKITKLIQFNEMFYPFKEQFQILDAKVETKIKDQLTKKAVEDLKSIVFNDMCNLISQKINYGDKQQQTEQKKAGELKPSKETEKEMLILKEQNANLQAQMNELQNQLKLITEAVSQGNLKVEGVQKIQMNMMKKINKLETDGKKSMNEAS